MFLNFEGVKVALVLIYLTDILKLRKKTPKGPVRVNLILVVMKEPYSRG